jgi:uncharacterized protein (DUF1778 family)
MAKKASKKVGRPRSLLDGDVRDKRLNLRMATDEWDTCFAAAKAIGSASLSDYVRDAALAKARDDLAKRG